VLRADRAVRELARATARADWAAAVAAGERAHRLHPADRLVLFRLGAALLQQGRAREAAAVLEAGLEHYPEFLQGLGNLGLARWRQGDGEGARAALVEVLRLDPGDALARHTLGRIDEAQGRLPEALGAYRELARRRPDLAWNQYRRGEVALRLGRLDEAEQAFTAVLASDPDDVAARAGLGRVHRLRDAVGGSGGVP
jgi:tetratricopeptide (TPR) repeat protein